MFPIEYVLWEKDSCMDATSCENTVPKYCNNQFNVGSINLNNRNKGNALNLNKMSSSTPHLSSPLPLFSENKVQYVWGVTSPLDGQSPWILCSLWMLQMPNLTILYLFLRVWPLKPEASDRNAFIIHFAKMCIWIWIYEYSWLPVQSVPMSNSSC